MYLSGKATFIIHFFYMYVSFYGNGIKVEELDLPIKRNQGLVMKYFMEYRDRIAEIIDNSDKRCLFKIIS